MKKKKRRSWKELLLKLKAFFFKVLSVRKMTILPCVNKNSQFHGYFRSLISFAKQSLTIHT